jgi:hypothetical protein
MVVDATDIAPQPPSTPRAGWRVAQFVLPSETPPKAWSLKLSAPATAEIELLLPAAPDAAWSPSQALRDIAQQCVTDGDPAGAAAWEGLARLLPGTGEAALALRNAADAIAAAGDEEEAARVCLQALRQVGTEAGVWRTFAGEPGYAQNRAAADLGDELRGRLTGLAGACPDDLGARAYRAAASQYPPLPAATRAALRLASVLERTGHPAEAVPWALLCLDAAGGHDPIQATLRLAENQRSLAQIAAPTEPKVLAGALELLLRYFGGSMLYVELISALAIVGDCAGAEAELETLLAMENCADNQANAALNLASSIMMHGEKARARKWFGYVAEHFPGTHFAELAQKRLDQGLTLPWEEKKQ